MLKEGTFFSKYSSGETHYSKRDKYYVKILSQCRNKYYANILSICEKYNRFFTLSSVLVYGTFF
jgi:hypothetical protein